MNDNQSADKQGKPTVFYAKKSAESKSSQRSYQGNDSRHQRGSAPRHDQDKSSHDKRRTERSKMNRETIKDNRIEMFRPRSRNNSVTSHESPWKSRVQKSEQLATFENDTTILSNQQLKRQRKEETLVYSENSCKAIFAKRPESIIKAFFLQEKTHEFKPLIAWLVERRLGYDIVDEAHMSKIAQTQHHGGVCLIVKKRSSLTTATYLAQNNDAKYDYVMAIDDINNPHNLGAIARTAAFFKVNGVMLRQPDILDNGASLRVSEGGAEYLTPIKADDFIVSLDQFKQYGYQIVALLPCKVNTIKAENLTKLSVRAKTVFVIFQQINLKLVEFADKVVYLSGSEAMPALNISVLSGILLAKIDRTHTK